MIKNLSPTRSALLTQKNESPRLPSGALRPAKFWFAIAAALAAPGCAGAPPMVTNQAFAPPTDALLRVDDVNSRRLAYAPDQTAFAPILTEPFAYPTQAQARNAYARWLQTASSEPLSRFIVPAPSELNGFAVSREIEGPPFSIRLFGCKPGALNPQTARIERYLRPIVHCATDFTGSDGRRISREIVNFAFDHGAWRMQITNPPHTPVVWRARESSPRDPWRWVPCRERYE